MKKLSYSSFGMVILCLLLTHSLRAQDLVLFLVDTENGADVLPLSEQNEINLNELGVKAFSIRAEAQELAPKSVKFSLFGPSPRVQLENVSPYLLFGDDTRGKFFSSSLKDGAYKLIVEAYSELGSQGNLLARKEISFEMINPGLQVAGLTLMDAENDQEIAPLEDGDVIYLDELGTDSLNILANTQPTNVGSVSFELLSDNLDLVQVTENIFPYALFGDNGTRDFKSGSLAPGNYTLKVTPYELKKRGGRVGTPLQISFEIKERNNSEDQWRFVWQNPAIKFPSPGFDSFELAIQSGTDHQGNLYVSGGEWRLYGIGSTYPETFIKKYDPNGQLIWKIEITSRYRDFEHVPNDLAVDPEGNTYVTISLPPFSDIDPSDNTVTFERYLSLLIKYTPDGELAWFRDPQGAHKVTTDTNGNVYLTIRTNSVNQLIKYDTDGNLLNSRTIPTISDEVVVNPEKQIFVYKEPRFYDSKFSIAKYDRDLSHLWTVSPQVNKGESLQQIELVPDLEGGIWLTGLFRGTLTLDSGESQIISPDNTKYFLARYGNDGSLNWFKSFDPNMEPRTYVRQEVHLDRDAQGSFYFSGSFQESIKISESEASLRSSPGKKGAFLAQYDPQGNLLSQMAIEQARTVEGMTASPEGDISLLMDDVGNDLEPGDGFALAETQGVLARYTLGEPDYPPPFIRSLLWSEGSPIQNHEDLGVFYQTLVRLGLLVRAPNVNVSQVNIVLQNTQGDVFIDWNDSIPPYTFPSHQFEENPFSAGNYQFIIVIDDNEGLAQDTLIKDLTLTGSYSVNSTNLMIYPNQSTGPIHLKSMPNSQEILDISICNQLGDLVYKGQLKKEALLNIDLSPFGSGLYIIRSQSKSGVQTQRVLIR